MTTNFPRSSWKPRVRRQKHTTALDLSFPKLFSLYPAKPHFHRVMDSPSQVSSAAGSRDHYEPNEENDIHEGLANSFFPAPPPAWKRYTAINLELANLLKAQRGDEAIPENWRANQDELLAQLGRSERPEFDLRELIEPPRVDWIEQEGSWTAFGQAWPIEERLATLEESGVQQLYDSDLGS